MPTVFFIKILSILWVAHFHFFFCILLSDKKAVLSVLLSETSAMLQVLEKWSIVAMRGEHQTIYFWKSPKQS